MFWARLVLEWGERASRDREQVVKLDRGQLPKDVIHRGYREVTIQNIVFKTDTVLYRLERLYSASTGKLYEAQLPVELRGQSYGKELEAFAIMLYYELRGSQEKIVKLLQSQNLVISAGKIARLLRMQYLEKLMGRIAMQLPSVTLITVAFSQLNGRMLKQSANYWRCYRRNLTPTRD